MSMEHSEKITCPDCGVESDFVIWQSINTMIDPETKAKVLSGEIFRFKCPKCGSETNIMYDCLYHQMEDKLMIQIVHDDKDVPKAAESFDQISKGSRIPDFPPMMSDYTFRIVRDQFKLREKVNIFNRGLDDRVIELMKIILRFHLMEEKPELHVIDLVLIFKDNAPEEFAVRSEGDKWGSFPFIQEMYDKIKADYIDPDDDGKKIYIVDPEWAIHYLNDHHNKANDTYMHD